MENFAATDVPLVPETDCVFVVGPELVRIPANSHFLKAVSRPFRAMFGLHWREGHEMSICKGPLEILLPEDDATALKLLLLVIHYQNDAIPDKLPARTILAVAVAADKYDCIRALQFASESWLRPDPVPIDDLAVLAAASYRLRNAVAFWNITKRMILNHDGPFNAIVGADVLNETNWRILGQLEQARAKAILQFAEILINGIHDPSSTCVHQCGWSSRYAYAYMNLLQTRGLWPGALSHISIADAIARAEVIPDPVPNEGSSSCSYSYKHSAPEYRKNRDWSLTNLDKMTGLCLHCIESDGQSSACCHIKH